MQVGGRYPTESWCLAGSTVGRSASAIPDTLLRTREAVRHMGQVGGMAAALAVQHGVHPRDLGVKELQKRLLTEGFYLGDEARLNRLQLR